MSYGGGFGGGRSTSDVKAASALSSSSLPWLEPLHRPGRGARDDDNGEVNDVNVVGVDRQRPVGIHMAGGWVRNKLLNQHSANVNMALDCMIKVQFARIMQRYMGSSLSSSWLSSTGKEDNDEGGAMTTKDDDDGGGGGGVKERWRKRRARRRHPKIGVIGANPSQSKHLKTATMKIHGINVNFVNLCANMVYGADSRIPTFGSARGSCGPAFGAPLEDALHCDFTINW